MLVLTTGFGEPDLFLALGKTGAVFRRALIVAASAGNAFLEELRELVFRRNRATAGAAKLHIAFGQAMANGNARSSKTKHSPFHMLFPAEPLRDI